MTAIPAEKLDKLVQRWEAIQSELNRGVGQAARVQLTKEFAELNPVVATIQALRKAEAEVEDLKSVIADPAADRELKELAEEESSGADQRVAELEQQLRVHLLPKDAADEKSAILEVRAGTGGDEAALFAADLFRMYSRYAEVHGWKTEIISLSENDLGGYKEIVASISGKGVFARLKYESGVHRVQRVPELPRRAGASTPPLPPSRCCPRRRTSTSRSGPRTSASIPCARAAPAASTSTRRIRRCASRICRPASSSSRPRNRSTRTGASPCRSCARASTSRSGKDWRMLAAAQRKGQVGSGDRSQRIRTYNFPQGRVTDHRIDLTLHKLDAVLEGTALDELIDALITEHQASELAAIEEGGNA